jgi:hypothetical protein
MIFLVLPVIAGHSRPKDGVASARLRPAIHVLFNSEEGVDARHKAGHDDDIEIRGKC